MFYKWRKNIIIKILKNKRKLYIKNGQVTFIIFGRKKAHCILEWKKFLVPPLTKIWIEVAETVIL